MKRFLLIAATFVAWASYGQNVTIPDANFKSFLLNYENFNTPSGNGLTIDANGDGEIQIAEAQAVTSLYISDSNEIQLGSLEGIKSFTNLEILDIGFTHITDLDISGLSNLTFFRISDRGVQTLNIDGLTSLQSCSLEWIEVDTLDFSASPNLETVNLMNLNNLISVDMGDNQSLTSLFLFSSSLTYLNLSGCPNLENANCSFYGVDEDIYINLKNGNSTYSNGGFTLNLMDSIGGNVGRCFVCIDEGEELIVPFPQRLITSTYCSFTPGGNYNTITGTVTYDAAGDGCDASDMLLPYAAVEINDGATTGYSYATAGAYNFYTQAGTFTLTPHFENDWFTTSPATVTFADNNNNTATQNFCVAPNGVHNDVEVIIAPIGAAQPGFDAAYKIIYKNKGNQTLSGALSFTYNDDVLDYVTAIPVETASAIGNLSWNYANLLPFESREIRVVLNVNSPMETPAVNIDDVLSYTVSITPVTGDETPADNSFTFNQVVVGSFDPNDITCLEGNSVNPEKIGEYLHYNINFENTGTAPATFVVVKDIIDLAKYDISTLQILNASHAMQAKIAGNKVEFIFDNINLAANGGKGNITFKIKTLNTLAVNSNVTQRADIFFDYNWPIVTNDAITTFEVLNIFIPVKDNSVKVYPNPVKDVVKVSANSVITSLQLFDLQGRVLQSQQYDANTTQLDLSGRAAGIYFVKVSTEKGASVQKVIKE
nr:T9SS type A sorting domain-containing protein [uncultured Flavobacterium sp.]